MAVARPPLIDADRMAKWGLVAVATVPLLLFVLHPLWSIRRKSFDTAIGIGFDNYLRYFGGSRTVEILGNTFAVSIMATAMTIVLAYGFAYAMHRSHMPAKGLLRLIALLPLFAPSLVQAQGLLLLLGRNGVINRRSEEHPSELQSLMR